MAAHVWTYLHLNDGSVITSTSHEWASSGSKWTWIKESYAFACDCSPDDISVEETEEGDAITAKGERVGYVINELRGVHVASREYAAEKIGVA